MLMEFGKSSNYNIAFFDDVYLHEFSWILFWLFNFWAEFGLF